MKRFSLSGYNKAGKSSYIHSLAPLCSRICLEVFFYLLQDLQQKCKKTGKNSWDPRGLSSLPYKVPVRYEHTYKAGLRIYIILYG